MKKISLRELISYVEFDYEIENNKIKLIDWQNVYLGDIADFRVEIDDEQFAIMSVIERLRIYWNDYVITALEEDLDVSNYKDWEELYKIAQDKYGDDTNKCTILGWIVNPEYIFIEEKGE